MSDFLALDWDDQQLVGVEARIGAKSVELRKWVRIEWTAEEHPSEHPQIAGQRLRAELNRLGIGTPPVLVSLPREDAIVRLLELPDCTDEELPDLVRFQAATRSAVPLERLLLDFLPLPPIAGVVGRRALMATLGKPQADRIKAVLTAAGLEASAIRLGTVGAAELVARQPSATSADPSTATLIVFRSGSRVELAVVSRNRVLLMHGGTLSTHQPLEAMRAQLLGETSRTAVALSQTAPGMRIGSGWILGSPMETASLSDALKQRFGIDFHVLCDPFSTPGVHNALGDVPDDFHAGIGPVGLLLGEAGRLVESVDFLHPRQRVVKKDRRRLRQALIGGGIAVAAIAGYMGLQLKVADLNERIAREEQDQRDRRKVVDAGKLLLETSGAVEDWNRRDLDWLDQLAVIAKAMGGSDKIHLTTFDGRIATRNVIAILDAAGRAKSRRDVETLEHRLADAGYKVNSKEKIPDPADRLFPEKLELNLELPEVAKPKLKPKSSATSPPTPETKSENSSKPVRPDSSPPGQAPKSASSSQRSAS